MTRELLPGKTAEIEERPSSWELSRDLSIVGIAALGVCIVVVTGLALSSAYDTYRLEDYIGAKDAAGVVRFFVAGGLLSAGLLLVVARLPIRFSVLRALPVLFGIAALLMALPSGGAWSVLIAALICLWCWLVGDAVLRVTGIPGIPLAAWERVALSTGLGIGLLSHAVLAFSLIGLATDAGLTLLLAIGLVAALGTRYARRSHEEPQMPVEATDGPDAITLGALALFGVAGLMMVGQALAPQLAYDVLNYHLTLPLAILRAGHFVERPDIVQSYVPLGLEMIFVPPMWLDGEKAATLLNWAFLPLTGAFIWSAGDRLGGKPAGLLAAAACVLMPFALHMTYTDSADLAATFFFVACAWFATVPDHRNSRNLIAVGVFAGFAVSFKLTAAYFIPIVVLLVIGRQVWQQRRRAIGPLAGFAAAGIVFGAPWLIIRYVQTGNPVFPTLNNIFRSAQWPPVNEEFDLPTYGLGKSAGDLSRILWEVTVHPTIFGQTLPPWILGVSVLLLLPAAVAVFVFARWRGGLVAWTVVSLAAIAVWALVTLQYHRYGMPAFMLTTLPAGWAAAFVIGRLWAPLRSPATLALVGCWFLVGVGVTSGSLGVVPKHYPADYLLGRQTDDEYRRLALTNYDAMLYLNEQMRGTDEMGMILGDRYHYYVENLLYFMHEPAEFSPFRRIAEETADPDIRARALIANGFHWVIADPYIGYPQWANERIMSADFLDAHMEPKFGRRGSAVYQIVAQAAPRGVNRLCNADFELSPEAAKCWLLEGNAELKQPKAPLHPSPAGVTALESTPSEYAVQSVRVCGGRTYRLAHYSTATDRSATVRLQINWLLDDDRQMSTDIVVVKATPQWQQHVMIATAPEHATIAHIYAVAHAGTAWLDGFEFGAANDELPPGCDE